MMQQLMESDPNIRQLITQNQQDFIRFLQEPVSPSDMFASFNFFYKILSLIYYQNAHSPTWGDSSYS